MSGIFEPVYRFIDALLPFTWLEPCFMKRALLVALIVSPMCASLGVLVVNFRMAFYASAVSHSAFTGIAIGLIAGIDPRLTLVAFGLFIGFVIISIQKSSELSEDTSIGVLFSTSVAAGIVVISYLKSLTESLEPFLYGDILSVGEKEIGLTAILAIIVSIYLLFNFNKLMLLGVHEGLARTRGIKGARVKYIFSLLLALAITLSIRTIGILLITALIIIPAATARNIARGAASLFWISIIVSWISAIFGLAGSYYWDTATGATIVLGAALCFTASMFVRPLIHLKGGDQAPWRGSTPK